MSHPALSVYVASWYVIGLGCGLILIPNIVLNLFGLPQTDEIWIRMLGMMTLFLGIFQLQIARAELRSFFRLSIILRLSVVGFVTAFIVTGLAAPVFMLISVMDVLGAGWTWVALNREEAKPVSL
jgi:hypothetical protein